MPKEGAKECQKNDEKITPKNNSKRSTKGQRIKIPQKIIAKEAPKR
ncbi:8038_t:CDS:1, partial [Racocetra fulgida]